MNTPIYTNSRSSTLVQAWSNKMTNIIRLLKQQDIKNPNILTISWQEEKVRRQQTHTNGMAKKIVYCQYSRLQLSKKTTIKFILPKMPSNLTQIG